MTLIECIRGEATTDIAGETYHFSRDAHGRYVARVHRHEHAACLLSVEHYREVPDEPQDVPVVMMTADAALLLAQPQTQTQQAAGVQTPVADIGPGAPVMIGIDLGVDPDAAPVEPPVENSDVIDVEDDDSGDGDFKDDFDDDEPDAAEDKIVDDAATAEDKAAPAPKRRGRPRKTAEA